ncbi:MAG: copper amine oxidase N-terminal domain-containing protein [Syntrophomonadales bacterium]
MKKLITLALAAIFTLSVFVPVFAGQKVAIKDQDQIKLVVFKIGDSNYYVEDKDGNIQTVPMDVAPYIKDGRTLVPARFLGNALGVPDEKITWDQATRTATLQGKKKLTLVIGSLNMKSDDEAVKMDVAPEIKSGRTMLLARYVAEGLGYEVGWDAVRKLVICWEEGTPQPDMSKILKEIEAEVITMGKGNTRISIRNVEGFFDAMPNDRWGIHHGETFEYSDGSVRIKIPANPLIYTEEQSQTYINETVRAIKAQYGENIGNKVAESLQKGLVSARDTTGHGRVLPRSYSSARQKG